MFTNFGPDDLPLWGHVGRIRSLNEDMEDATTAAATEYIYTHKIFTIGYNEDRVSKMDSFLFLARCIDAYPCR
jgi:hypothetical protein